MIWMHPKTMIGFPSMGQDHTNYMEVVRNTSMALGCISLRAWAFDLSALGAYFLAVTAVTDDYQLTLCYAMVRFMTHWKLPLKGAHAFSNIMKSGCKFLYSWFSQNLSNIRVLMIWQILNGKPKSSWWSCSKMLIPGSRIKPRQVKSCTFPAGRGVEKT